MTTGVCQLAPQGQGRTLLCPGSQPVRPGSVLTGRQPGLLLRRLHGTSPLQRVYFKSPKSILPMSTRRQPRGFQGHRSPVLVSPGQSLHSFYPLDPILCCRSLSLLASWPGSDLPAGGVPSSPASHCPPALFRVRCFQFLYSGLLLVFQVAGSHFLGEPAPFHTGPLYLNRVSFSLWGTYHKPSCLTSYSPFLASRTWHSPKGAKTVLSQGHQTVPGSLGRQERLAG